MRSERRHCGCRRCGDGEGTTGFDDDLSQADENTDADRVDEVDVGQIQRQASAVTDRSSTAGQQRRPGGEIERAVDDEHDAIIVSLFGDAEHGD